MLQIKILIYFFSMKITQIRNATLIIEYAGKRFLIDPMLGAKGSFLPYPFAGNWNKNPIVELPLSVGEILHNIDAVIATHYHFDHLDPTAFKVIPKGMKVFVKDERNRRLFIRKGFSNVEVLGSNTLFGGIKLSKTPAKHGTYPLLVYVGSACGVTFEHRDEKKLYLTGDTIWYDGVREVLDLFHPDIIIANSGGNKIKGFHRLIMNHEDVLLLHNYAPESIIVATHLEGVNHNMVTRRFLREFSINNGFSDKLLIPDDGETLRF